MKLTPITPAQREALVQLAERLKKTGQSATSLGCTPGCKATARIAVQNFAAGQASAGEMINKILADCPDPQ